MHVSKIQGILFDFDGVLIDSENLYFNIWQDLLRPFEIQFTRNDLIGRTGEQFLNQFDIKNKVDIILRKNELSLEMIPNIFIDSRVKNLIIELHKRNIRLAIVSNNSSLIIEKYLSKNGILNYFLNNIFSKDLYIDTNPKPSGDLYLKALNHWGFETSNLIAVEDSQIGFNSCNAANLEYVEFNYLDVDKSINNLKERLEC
jgi:putative hydrolase of the HAD superfamily